MRIREEPDEIDERTRTLSVNTVYAYSVATSLEKSTRRLHDDDFENETRRTLNSVSYLCDELISFINDARNSAVRTPKQGAHASSSDLGVGYPNWSDCIPIQRWHGDRKIDATTRRRRFWRNAHAYAQFNVFFNERTHPVHERRTQ